MLQWLMDEQAKTGDLDMKNVVRMILIINFAAISTSSMVSVVLWLPAFLDYHVSNRASPMPSIILLPILSTSCPYGKRPKQL